MNTYPQTIRLGSRSSIVAQWQGYIGATADGIFGPKTEASTKAWQKSHGLVADGIVGPKTWAAAALPTTLPPPPAPTATRILGIDVSMVQGVIDWDAVKAGGVEFAYIKASEGAGYTDPRFKQNVYDALDAGLEGVGAYTFARPDSSPGDASRECDYFLRLCEGLGLTMPGMLDLETKGALAGHVALAWAGEWVSRYRAYSKDPRCGIYTGKYFWQSLGKAVSGFEQLPLWFAMYPVDYTKNPAAARLYEPAVTVEPKVMAPWQKATIWQYSGTGGKRVAGVRTDCDRNVWLGTREEFTAFCSK